MGGYVYEEEEQKNNNTRQDYPKGPSNPLHIGDPYGDPRRHHQGANDLEDRPDPHRSQEAPEGNSRGLPTGGPLRDGMLHMMFKLGQCAEQNWRRLRGFDYLAKVIQASRSKTE